MTKQQLLDQILIGQVNINSQFATIAGAMEQQERMIEELVKVNDNVTSTDR